MTETQNNQDDAADKNKRSENRLRTAFIRARVTPEEKAEFLKRCQDRSLTAGDYIRKMCIDAKIVGRPPQRRINQVLLAQIIMEIGKMGKGMNNLNQLAHAMNIALLKPDVEGTELIKVLLYHQQSLEGVYETISELRTAVREMLLHRDPTS